MASRSLIGKVLGNYTIDRELGRGGMGIVYLAREESLQRIVALKVLAPELAKDEAYVKRFLREARAGARLNHPNIVPIHAVGNVGGVYFIAMAYIQGERLSDRIARHGQLAVRDALNIARQVASALVEAYENGIVHRDIKPENIMIDKAGRVQVMDFGLAHVMSGQSRLTADNLKLGTPHYMAPEQCKGQPMDGRTDLFSLGIVLYEMLAGDVPFKADTPLAVMYQITNEPLPPLNKQNAATPAPVVQLVTRLTAKEPSQRFDSAATLIQAIGQLGRPQSGHSVPSASPTTEQPHGFEISPDELGRTIVGSTPTARPTATATPSRFTMPPRRAMIVGGVIALLIVAVFLASRFEWGGISTGPWEDLIAENSLSGWYNPAAVGENGLWHVADGVLTNRGPTGTYRVGTNYNFATIREWRDFEVELEYRLAQDTNSGVYLRGRVEVQLLRKVESNPKRTNGAIYRQFEPLVHTEPTEEWSTLRARFINNRASVWMNGTQIHDERAISRYTGTQREFPGTFLDPGPIILQDTSGQAWFRNIRIREVIVAPGD